MGIKIRKFQMGGPMPMEDPAMAGAEAGAMAGAEAGAMDAAGGAPAGPEAGGDPVMQLVEMAMQALQSQDPNMALAVCEGLVSLTQGGGAEGGAPAPGGAPEEPVMMRKGGKVTVAKKGKKMSKKC